VVLGFVDPDTGGREAYKLRGGKWALFVSFNDNEEVCVTEFDAEIRQLFEQSGAIRDYVY